MNGWSYNMDFGLIGKNINYSYSQEIHQFFGQDSYQMINIEQEALPNFFKERNFKGINVTIPYKQIVIPYLDLLDETATKTGVVNTIVNENGVLKGYNTDYLALMRLLEQEEIDLSGKKCLILGSGATSKTVFTALRERDAFIIAVASRTPQQDMVSYQSLYHQTYDIIINTTPVGTYPQYDVAPVDLEKFPSLEFVIDYTYNPLRTKLIRTAVKRKIKSINGLELLVSQAYFARQLFDHQDYDEGMIENIIRKVYQNKLNIVLIGMPYCGKTTIAHQLAIKLNRPMMDTDILIEQKTGESITDLFNIKQEYGFRALEKQVIAELASTGSIIATGGGSILDADNMAKLCSEGLVFYLQKDKKTINIVGNNRPLIKNIDEWEQLANAREHLYVQYADVIINKQLTIAETVQEICDQYWKYIKRGK